MSNPTFTGREGNRIKNISHKNLWYHTKDAPMLIRWNKTGDSQYGPWAAFEVMNDHTGEYMYKPGKDAPDTNFWGALERKIKAAGNDFVAVRAGFDGDYPDLIMEDEGGGLVVPQQEQPQHVQQAHQQVEQARQMLDGDNTESLGALLKDCLEQAELAAGEVATEFGAEDIRAMGLTLFIQANR